MYFLYTIQQILHGLNTKFFISILWYNFPICINFICARDLIMFVVIYLLLHFFLVSSTNSSRSEVNQFVYTDLPYYPSYSSLTPFKSNIENASQTDKNCQKTTDKNVQTDLLSCACLRKSEKKSAQCVDTSGERSEYPENNVIDSTSDQGGTQNKLGYLDLAKQDVTQISEHNKLCDSANKHSSPESSSLSALLNQEKDGRKELEKEKSPQKKK